MTSSPSNFSEKDSLSDQKTPDPPKKPTYDDLGASHQKEDVHDALANSDKGLFPNAFCKIIPDIALDSEYCSIVHADGAGTKSSLAYMMYKETGNSEYFRQNEYSKSGSFRIEH